MTGVIIVGLVLIFLIGMSIDSAKQAKDRLRRKLKDEYEKPLDREIAYDVYQRIKEFNQQTAGQNPIHIDDDTWDDLNMDSIYVEMNNTNSAIGREYLYYLLHNPVSTKEELAEIDCVATYFHENEDMRYKFQEKFASLGLAGNRSVYAALEDMIEQKPDNTWFHYGVTLMYVAAILLAVFVRADIGIMALIAAVGVGVVSYYRRKAQIENYFAVTRSLVHMVSIAKDMSKINEDVLESYLNQINAAYSKTKVMLKNYYLITTGGTQSGSIFEIAMDYARILFHVDLIRYNKLIIEIQKYHEELLQLYKTFGFLESMIAVAAYRNKLSYWSLPQCVEGQKEYKVEQVYHPLIDSPVANTIDAGKCVLLTGSNASGKSTFLRTIAINALLSQTIATSPSKEYQGGFYHIVSSMSHKDDLLSGDSYYMVEIKSIKRILDLDGNVLCFLDEVLRGTNTVERIAASTQILKQLAKKNILCFAATHDIELTKLLEDSYDNYHFDESFVDNDVKYSYNLLNGPASTRNAIRLLLQNGYDSALVEQANAMTKVFEEQGVWKKM